MEDQVGGGAGQVEGLQIRLADGVVPVGHGQDERRALRERLGGAGGRGPALAVPGVEGLAHPVGRPLGADVHDHGVAELSPQRRVEAVGEAEVPADAGRARWGAGPGQLRGRPGVAGERPGDADRTADPGARPGS